MVSANSATWIPSDVGASTFQWERDGSPISGATSATYTVVPADHGSALTVVETRSAAGFVAGSRRSEPVSVAAPTLAAIARSRRLRQRQGRCGADREGRRLRAPAGGPEPGLVAQRGGDRGRDGLDVPPDRSRRRAQHLGPQPGDQARCARRCVDLVRAAGRDPRHRAAENLWNGEGRQAAQGGVEGIVARALRPTRTSGTRVREDPRCDADELKVTKKDRRKRLSVRVSAQRTGFATVTARSASSRKVR
ncbi:hypothetical protein [Aeromicrobium sp. UC242_57]|uniref:hypothetical protein n=1 Tax=Aeromicrobium sp. UC242_57 TaxID=3374624 RepID=UPI0037C0880F